MKLIDPQLYNECSWTSAQPGLILILIDQSLSMHKKYLNGLSRAEFSCNIVNKFIDNIIQRSWDGEAPKNRCFVSVIGYNTNVTELRSGWLKDLAEKPLRFEKMQQKIPDGTGGILTLDVENPVWIEPTDIQGVANMKGAFEQARSFVKRWMQDFPDFPAPVIMNFTSNDCISADQLDAVVDIAEELITLPYTFQKVRLLNIGIGCESKKTILPSVIEDISNPHDRVLWDISSEVDNNSKIIYNESGFTTGISPKFLLINGTSNDVLDMITKISSLCEVIPVPVNPYRRQGEVRYNII